MRVPPNVASWFHSALSFASYQTFSPRASNAATKESTKRALSSLACETKTS